MIDWNFIESLEGRVELLGYVPTNGKGDVIGNSGVTIGSGVDLGQMSKTELVDLFMGVKPFPFDLVSKLRYYAGSTKLAALMLLRKRPLKLDKEEAELLTHLIREKILSRLTLNWNEGTGIQFSQLPDAAQTVLYSLAYNFGPELKDKYPETWLKFADSAYSGNWMTAFVWLADFPSKNPELIGRRQKEAEYLRKYLLTKD